MKELLLQYHDKQLCKSKKSLYILPEYGHEYLPKISDWLRENQ